MMAFDMVIFHRSITPGEDARAHLLESGKAPPGLELFRQLFSQKLLPVNLSSGWHLLGVHNDIRTWEKRLTAMEALFVLYGCSTSIPQRPEDILAILTNVTKQPEWDNSVSAGQYIAFPTTTDETVYPVKVDVVSYTMAHDPPLLVDLWNKMVYGLKLSAEFVTRGGYKAKKTSNNFMVARNWRMEEDHSCWLFTRNVDGGNTCNPNELWSYFMIQPIIGDLNKAIVHYISCQSSSSSSVCQGMADQLAALKQCVELERLKPKPIKHSSLRHVADSNALREADFLARNSLGGSERHLRSSRSLTGSSSSLPEGVNSNLTSSPSARNYRSYSSIGFQLSTIPLKSEGQPTRRRLSARTESSSDDGFSSGRRKRSRRRSSFGEYYDSASLSSQASLGGAGGMTSADDEEIPTYNPLDYEFLGKQCALTILEEATHAASINVNAHRSEQKQKTKGWVFHCLEKEVVILKKKRRKGRTHSFLGKSLIKIPPDVIFGAVMNPRTRFIYDNMLKKLNVLQNPGSDLIIYHAVHEVSHFLRKESRDFCILQYSQKESEKYVVAFCSVNPPECQATKGVIRGRVLPSGWIIEPAGDNKSQYSMVTYVVQFSLGGKNVPSTFYNFLSTRIPLSIAYLRTFLEAQLPP